MAARSIRSTATVLPLLTLLLLGASPAANSPERAVAAARTALDRGEVVRARQIVDDALRAFGNQDRLEVWTLRVMRGEVALTEGDMPKVIRELAFELPAKFRNSPAAVRRLLYQASALGSKEKQEPLLNAAQAIATRHQPLLRAEVARAKARLFGSEKEAREAVRLADEDRLAVERAKARVTLASILIAQQRFAEAIEVGEQGLAFARPQGLANTIQNVEGTLGWAYFDIGDYEAAAELFASAEASAGRIGNRLNQAMWLIQLGNVHFQKRDFATADRYNERALAVGARDRDRGYALANRARAALELGRYTDAGVLNAQALEAKRAVKDEEAERSSQIVEARIAAAQKQDYTRAEKMLLAVLEKPTKHELEARTHLAGLYARTGRHELARTAYRKAAETARVMRGNIEGRELRFAFFNTVPDMLDAYVDLLLTMKRTDEALAVIEASRAEALEEGRADELPRLDPEAIAKQNRATILSYWLGRDRSYLWVITAATTTLHPLPAEAVIEKEVEAYRRAVTRGDSMAATAARGERLYEMLVAPARIAKGTRVIVVADGQLHTLPFYTLVAPAPRRYWIEDVTVISAASLRLLTRKAQIIPSASPSALIVGNTPSYDRAFPPLQHAPQEIAAIRRRFVKKTVLEGAKATPAAYHAASPGTFDYLHFVAHGVAMRKRPLDSAVLLAKGPQSYKLLAREVAETPLKARLVTISSCESAGTRTYAGEGVIGLAWAFLHAGADQVIASLWKVSDDTTPQLMDEMYDRILKGEDPADALRHAKLRMLHSGTRASRPFYWAPFVLYAGT